MNKPVAIVNTDFDDRLTLDLVISNVCNYSCHYCHPGSNDGTKSFPDDYDLYKKNLSHFIDTYRNHFNKKDIRIEITGGEPTVWPKLGEFVTWLKLEKQINHVQVVTNGSRTLRWFKEFGHLVDEFHLSFHNDEGDVNHMIEVADYLYHNTSSFVSVNVIMDPNKWDVCETNLNKFVEHQTPFLVKAWMLVKSGEVRLDYTPEQLEFFREKVKKYPPQSYIDTALSKGQIPHKSKAKVVYDNGVIEPYNSYDLRTNNQHNYMGWLCNLGVDRASIFVGDIVGSCGATNLYNREPLKLTDPEFISKFTPDIIKPIVCTQLSCASCTKDIKIPKAKIHVSDKRYFNITPRNN